MSVVLVDAHEPGFPGDEGDSGKWDDYVYFTGQYYFNNKLNNCVKNIRQYGCEHDEIEGTNKIVEILVEPFHFFLCVRE